MNISQNYGIETCLICFSSIYNSRHKTSVSCPNCGRQYHLSHLIDYLEINYQCPACLKKLPENYVQLGPNQTFSATEVREQSKTILYEKTDLEKSEKYEDKVINENESTKYQEIKDVKVETSGNRNILKEKIEMIVEINNLILKHDFDSAKIKITSFLNSELLMKEEKHAWKQRYRNFLPNNDAS